MVSSIVNLQFYLNYSRNFIKFLMIFFIVFLSACQKKKEEITITFEQSTLPQKPDFKQIESWAAHPSKQDMADSLPKNLPQELILKEQNVDIFYIYPTSYLKKENRPNQWNAAIDDFELNKTTETSSILNQASVFNGLGRIFAPRYRQAHLWSFFENPDIGNGKKALQLAYSDVKEAFEYYLKNENNGRPIIIAGHSQGSLHGKLLLQEFFDGKPLQNKLIMAYLPGMSIKSTEFKYLQSSKNAFDVGVWASWNTFSADFEPENLNTYFNNAVSINPLSWSKESQIVMNKNNIGGVGRNFTFMKNPCSAQVHEGILWMGDLNIPGAKLLKIKNWHFADYNLYWGAIRKNAYIRAEQYFIKNQ